MRPPCLRQAASTLASEANFVPGRVVPRAGIVPSGPRSWGASVREDGSSYLFLMVSRKNPGRSNNLQRSLMIFNIQTKIRGRRDQAATQDVLERGTQTGTL